MRTTGFVMVVMLSSLGSAGAQPAAPLVRADVLGTLGWLNVDKGDIASYDNWYHDSLFAGASVGWYWTDHLKTELDAGESTDAEVYRFEPVQVGPNTIYVNSRAKVGTTRVAVSQQYQFFRNAWFHPHLAAGIDWTWERTREEFEPAFFYDPGSRQPQAVLPGRSTARHTTVRVRPFAAAGFKAYMTPRAFFRSDVRLALRGGVDEVLWRFGLGVDF